MISWHRLLHNLPVLLPPLPPVPYPTGGEIPILFLPAASTNNLAGKLFFFSQDTCYALSKGLWGTLLSAGGIQTPARALGHLPPAWVEGKGQGKGSGAEGRKVGMTQSCHALDKGAMGDVQEGKPKPGRAAKKHEVGRRPKGREAEWLGGSSRAGGRAGSELLRFLLLPVPFSLFLLVEGKCF